MHVNFPSEEGRPVNTEGPAQSDGGRWQGERAFREGPTGK